MSSLQVVAGIKYQFDLVLKTKRGYPVCKPGMGRGDSCHVEVYERAWEDHREIDWDRTTCSKKKQNPEQGEHTMIILLLSSVIHASD